MFRKLKGLHILINITPVRAEISHIKKNVRNTDFENIRIRSAALTNVLQSEEILKYMKDRRSHGGVNESTFSKAD